MHKYRAETLAKELREKGYDVSATPSKLSTLNWEVVCKSNNPKALDIWDPTGNYAHRFCTNGLVKKL